MKRRNMRCPINHLQYELCKDVESNKSESWGALNYIISSTLKMQKRTKLDGPDW